MKDHTVLISVVFLMSLAGLVMVAINFDPYRVGFWVKLLFFSTLALALFSLLSIVVGVVKATLRRNRRKAISQYG